MISYHIPLVAEGVGKYIHIHICANTHIYVQAQIHLDTHTHTRKHIHTHMHTYTHTCTHTHTHTHIDTIHTQRLLVNHASNSGWLREKLLICLESKESKDK